MSERQIDDEFEAQVEWMVNMYKGWLVNLQRDAYAQDNLIAPEVIAQAFAELREYYDILAEETDIDGVIDKLLGDQ